VLAAPPLYTRSGFEVANWIHHVHDPSRLILAWQAPEHHSERKRFAVGEVLRQNATFILRYFVDTPDVNDAKALGYEGYPAFSLKQIEHSKDVLAAFMRRLPPRSRPDFGQYLEGLRLTPMTTLSDFALLGYSEAKLPSDGFSLVDTLEDACIPSEFLLELAGYRHYPPSLTAADLGAPVSIEREPTNLYDPFAVVVHYEGRTIGYINRLQAPVVGRWVSENRVSAVLDRLNGRSDKPRAYIFLRTVDIE
jgi:hypothetical protein